MAFKMKGGNDPMKKNFPDLTGDGKVTQADILKGRGVFQKDKNKERKNVRNLPETPPVTEIKKKKSNVRKNVDYDFFN